MLKLFINFKGNLISLRKNLKLECLKTNFVKFHKFLTALVLGHNSTKLDIVLPHKILTFLKWAICFKYCYYYYDYYYHIIAWKIAAIILGSRSKGKDYLTLVSFKYFRNDNNGLFFFAL